MNTMKRVRTIVVLLFGVVALPEGLRLANATTLPVPSVMYPTIQAALNNATAGDTVLVMPGTYTGPDNRNLSLLGRDVVLRSSDGPGVTTIDCEGMDRGFRFNSTETTAAEVSGFTVMNGTTDAAGGAFFFSGASATIRNCRMKGNHGAPGGAISVTGGAAPLFVDCDIDGNQSNEEGGAIHVSFASPAFTNCRIRGNRSEMTGGAAVVFSAGSTTFTSCLITGNSAPNAGGILVSFGSAATISVCTLGGNEASGNGGAIRIDGGMVLLENSIVRANCAMGGPAVWMESSSTLTPACSFFDVNEVGGFGAIQLGHDNSGDDPLFCEPLTCGAAPSVEGDYGLMTSTPVEPAAFACGTIGAIGVTCDDVPVQATTWGAIKVGIQRR